MMKTLALFGLAMGHGLLFPICSIDKWPKLFSRNTRVENLDERAMMVEVRQTSPDVLVMTVEIPPGEHRYICHEDIPGPAGGRPGYVIVYIEGARETCKKDIHPVDIRASQKLTLDYSSEGGFTVTLTRGNFIQRLGFIIQLKRIAQCYGRGNSRLLEGVGNNAAKEEDLKGKVDLEDP